MERNQVEKKYLWKTEDIFESDEKWEEGFKKIESPDFSAYRGTLKDAEHILQYLRAQDEYDRNLMRVFLYAYMKHDEDVRIAKYGAYLAKTTSVMAKAGAESAFAVPELTALDNQTLEALASDEGLSDYDYFFKRLIAMKKHVLTEEEARVVAAASEPLTTASDVYEMLNNAELGFPEIEYQGETVKLTHGMYGNIINGNDREKRAEAFKLMYGAYRKHIGTFAAAYYGSVKQDIFLKTVRKFDTCLEMALFEEDVDKSVYNTLLASVNENLHLMHRYMALRKQLLGLDKVHMYDIGCSLADDADFTLTFEEAFDLVLEGLSPLGKEYGELLKKGRDERWIDVMETDGKKSGAYSLAIYGVHPYVLLNYQSTMHDAFALAHEMGHSLHTYFSAEAQPYPKSDYKIFVAEVASTVNEVLLLKHLVNTTKNKKLKKYLIGYYLELIRITFFRQSQFAEFEAEAHAMAERGEPLNKDNLSECYYAITKKYYGSEMECDKDIEIEWARVPHLYSAFYVYKYATGITAAVAIVDKILKEGEPAVKRYFNFLSSGSKTDPVSLLKIAGVDLNDKSTYNIIMKEFENALNEMARAE